MGHKNQNWHCWSSFSKQLVQSPPNPITHGVNHLGGSIFSELIQIEWSESLFHSFLFTKVGWWLIPWNVFARVLSIFYQEKDRKHFSISNGSELENGAKNFSYIFSTFPYFWKFTDNNVSLKLNKFSVYQTRIWISSSQNGKKHVLF